MPGTGKPTARTSAAGVKKSTSFDIAASGDTCFLCGNTIGESDPIGFYQGRSAMVRCHRGCINIMDINGGTPKDFHRYMEAQNDVRSLSQAKPVHQDIEALKLEVEVPEWRGPKHILFDDFAAMQTFIVAKGPIPDHVRVNVGSYVVQAGA